MLQEDMVPGMHTLAMLGKNLEHLSIILVALKEFTVTML